MLLVVWTDDAWLDDGFGAAADVLLSMIDVVELGNSNELELVAPGVVDPDQAPEVVRDEINDVSTAEPVLLMPGDM